MSAVRPDRRRTTCIAVALALALVGLAGCAPQTPDNDTWTGQAEQALTDTMAQVATAGLVLDLQRDDKVPHPYQQVVAQDAEEAAGLTMESFGSVQPPPGRDDAYRDVTSVLSDASDLLAQVRIAVVREDVDRYAALRR